MQLSHFFTATKTCPSDIVCYFLVNVIFYCANTSSFHMPDRNFSEGGR